MQADWRIILCELNGHYDGSPAFSGIDGACGEIEDYVKKNCRGELHGLVGLSLGGTIVISILSRGKIRIRKAMLDAAFCVDMGVLRNCYAFFFPKGVIRVRDGK